jgi:hypothetical protein
MSSLFFSGHISFSSRAVFAFRFCSPLDIGTIPLIARRKGVGLGTPHLRFASCCWLLDGLISCMVIAISRFQVVQCSADGRKRIVYRDNPDSGWEG